MMTAISANDVSDLARAEVARILDPVVRGALASRLIAPEIHLRDWDYGSPGEQYPCWTVLTDPFSDAAIVYSRHGHGPGNPWGLATLSDRWFGVDSGWFLRLEDAFVESCLAEPLLIWNVIAPDGRVVHRSLPMKEALARREALDAEFAETTHHVVYRSLPSGGVP
ncbi:MAG: hypothetical protein K0R38_958 [Polyangiaceae bacterium]|jgi:hypothetical protein|nr:hypothetical protein [Polyangiaceae bacterium]